MVNDGSTDGTLKIIESYFSKDEIIIISKPNGGAASALNEGIKHSTGDWIKWLSSDDLLYTKCLEKMMEEINKLQDNQNHIYYTNYEIIDEKGFLVKTFMEPDHNSESIPTKNAILYSNYYGNGTTSLIHKSVFEKIGYFDESLRTGEDYDFWLRASFRGISLHLIPIIQAGYRVHGGQMTKTKLGTVMKNVEIIRKRALELLPSDQKIQLKKDVNNYIPKAKKIRKLAKSLLFGILPEDTSLKIIRAYLKFK